MIANVFSMEEWSWSSPLPWIAISSALILLFWLHKKRVLLVSVFLSVFAALLVGVALEVYFLCVSDVISLPISYLLVISGGCVAVYLVGLTFFHFFIYRGEPLTVYGVSRLGTPHRYRSGWFLGLFFFGLEKIWRTVELTRTDVDGETKPEVANSATLPMQWNLDYQADDKTQKKLENFCRFTSKENLDDAIRDAINNIISELVRNKTVDDVKNDRAELNQQILRAFLNRSSATGESFPEYFGIRVLNFELEDVEIPAEVEKAKQAILVAEAETHAQEQKNKRFSSEMDNLRENAVKIKTETGVSGKEALLAAQRQVGKVTTEEKITTYDGGSNFISILPELVKLFKGVKTESSPLNADDDCLIIYPDGRREVRGQEARDEIKRTKGGRNAGK